MARAAFLAALLFIFTSCDKTKDFGLKTTPPDQGFNTSEEKLDIILHTEIQDSLATNNLPEDVIGSYYDPELGPTDAIAYTQLQLSDNGHDFGSNPVADSAILYIAYTGGGNGDYSTPQSWKVYELTQSLTSSETNYSTRPLASKPLPIGSYSGKINPLDTVLRIPMTQAFATGFIAASKDRYADQTAFLTAFPGIAIAPDRITTPGQGALFQFLLSSSKTRLALFYHNDAGKNRYDFITGTAAVRAAAYNHNAYAGIDLKKGIYLQSLAGLRVNIQLPDTSLRRLALNGVTAIHQAELVFPKKSGTYPYAEPASLKLFPEGQGGNIEITNTAFNQVFVDDRFPEYNGNLRSDKSYSFILTRHLQNLLARYKKDNNYKDTMGLNLFIGAEKAFTQRIQLTNKGDANAPYLRIIYTKQKEQ